MEGEMNISLSRPNSIVLSKSLALKIFGDVPVVGKQVFAENKVIFTVTGVYEDLPYNSEWHPVFLLPMLSFSAITGWHDYEDNYWAYSFFTYVLLKPNADHSMVDRKIQSTFPISGRFRCCM
jgi:putative ABC transport system permease protein